MHLHVLTLTFTWGLWVLYATHPVQLPDISAMPELLSRQELYNFLGSDLDLNRGTPGLVHDASLSGGHTCQVISKFIIPCMSDTKCCAHIRTMVGRDLDLDVGILSLVREISSHMRRKVRKTQVRSCKTVWTQFWYDNASRRL